MSENQVRFWLTRFRKLDPNVKSHRETLINTFVNAVYLYDEKVLIIFNYKDGTKTITFDEIAAKDAPEGNGSDLGCFAPPKTSTYESTLRFLFCYKARLTGWVDSNNSGPPNSPAGKKPLRGLLDARLAISTRAHQKNSTYHVAFPFSCFISPSRPPCLAG
ncbi:MAG: hypothetical protein ACLU9R_00250 [Faecalibacterium sp.]